MGKVVIHATISLDGFIAELNDDLSWMNDFQGPSAIADNIIKDVGAIITGGHMFRAGEGHLEEKEYQPYGGSVKAPVFVLTHHLREKVTGGGLTFRFTNDFEDAVKKAKTAAGEKNVMLFGGTMAQLGLNSGLADEIVLHVTPLLLGSGKRLFPDDRKQHTKLERIEVATEAPDVTDMRFKVVKDKR